METFEGQSRHLDEGPGLLQSVWRYWWLIAIATLLGALLGYGWQARQPTVYEGSTRLLLSIGSGVLPGDPAAPAQEPRRFLSNQAALIASRPVLQRAARGKTDPGSLKGRMTVEVADGADVITIRVHDATPEGAAELAQAIGTAYNQFVITQSAQAAATEVKQLEAAADDLKVQLSKLSLALRADPNNPTLQAKLAAIRDQLTVTVTQSERLAPRAKNGASPVQWQEPAVISRQPIQPAPRRGAMAGLLLALVGSAALAWWLNSRATKQEVEWERRDERRAWPEDEDEFVRAEPPLDQQRARDRMGTVASGGNGAIVDTIARFVRPTARQATTLHLAAERPGYNRGPTAVDPPAEDLRRIFGRLEATLGSEPLDWYLDNVPQFMAEQVTTRVYAEMAAVLLDNDRGSFAVAGGFGLTPEEQGAIVDQSHDALREALAEGVGIFQDGTDRTPTAAAGVPGSQSTQALVMVPLVDGASWHGMLLVGRHSANGHRVASFNDQELEQIILYAIEIAPLLHLLVLLDRLQVSVRSLEVSHDDDDAAPAAGAGSL